MINKFKYPRTFHVPYSLGATSDDKMLQTLSHFDGKEVVVTEKYDGENTTLYSDYYHARSIDGRHHPSRDWVKQFWGSIRHDIPGEWRICGENMYARHSIPYENLESFFLGFSVWDGKNVCMSWDDTITTFSLIGITPVRVLYRGVFDLDKIKQLWTPNDYDTMEGYVIRLQQSFEYDQFKNSVAKFVRKGHVTAADHWMHQQIVPNKMK